MGLKSFLLGTETNKQRYKDSLNKLGEDIEVLNGQESLFTQGQPFHSSNFILDNDNLDSEDDNDSSISSTENIFQGYHNYKEENNFKDFFKNFKTCIGNTSQDSNTTPFNRATFERNRLILAGQVNRLFLYFHKIQGLAKEALNNPPNNVTDLKAYEEKLTKRIKWCEYWKHRLARSEFLNEVVKQHFAEVREFLVDQKKKAQNNISKSTSPEIKEQCRSEVVLCNHALAALDSSYKLIDDTKLNLFNTAEIMVSIHNIVAASSANRLAQTNKLFKKLEAFGDHKNPHLEKLKQSGYAMSHISLKYTLKIGVSTALIGGGIVLAAMTGPVGIVAGAMLATAGLIGMVKSEKPESPKDPAHVKGTFLNAAKATTVNKAFEEEKTPYAPAPPNRLGQ